jgi:hypothetical protein
MLRKSDAVGSQIIVAAYRCGDIAVEFRGESCERKLRWLVHDRPGCRDRTCILLNYAAKRYLRHAEKCRPANILQFLPLRLKTLPGNFT